MNAESSLDAPRDDMEVTVEHLEMRPSAALEGAEIANDSVVSGPVCSITAGR